LSVSSDKENRKFVHWTSVQNLMSIINNREFRLYNLHNSSDHEEFVYSAEKLLLSEKHIEYSKRYLYTLSFCEAKELNNSDLWESYGQKYTGVAIEFEINNDPNFWKKFILSEVFYKLPNKFISLKYELDKLQKKYPGTSYFIDLGKLIAFHKKTMFSREREIRLATYFPYDRKEAYEVFGNTEFKYDKDKVRITDYIPLKLWVNNTSPFVKGSRPEFDKSLKVEESYFDKNPRIKISGIHFGKNCMFKGQDFIPFWKKLNYITKIKLGYEIENLKPNLYG